MELKALATISFPDPDGGKEARNIKIGDIFDDLPEEKLDLYLERGIVEIVGGAAPQPPEPEPKPEPKPKPAQPRAKKATTKRKRQ